MGNALQDKTVVVVGRGNNPAGRIGTPEDIASAALFSMTNSFLTGVTLKIDGGEPLT